MKCQTCRRMISRELDGAIDAVDAGELERHVSLCEPCASFRERSRAAFAVHRYFGEAAPPPSLLPTILAAVEERRGAGFIRTHFRFAMSAAAVAAAVVGFWMGGMMHESYLPESAGDAGDVLGLAYLDEYPPGSLGYVLTASDKGGADE